MKNILLKHLLFTRRSSPTQSQTGFSMIEMIVITLIIGILSAITLPSWQAFLTRQRIRTVNDQVFQALRSAQSDAKAKKTTKGVVFLNITNPDIPTLWITSLDKYYKLKTDGTFDKIDMSSEKEMRKIELNANGEIKKGTIKVTIGECTDQNCTSSVNDPDAAIFYNYLGAVAGDTAIANAPKQNTPFFVTTSTFDGKVKKCVIVETLLGGMRSAQGSQCP